MERNLTITDYGKDYGFGRYVLMAPGIHKGSNDYREISEIAAKFGDPCVDCGEEAWSCEGQTECLKTYGRCVKK